MREIRPKRARVKTDVEPCVYPPAVLECRDHLYAWSRAVAPTTERTRLRDIRYLGRWQWGANDPATILAWLLNLPADDAASVIARFDAAEAKTGRHAVRKRRLHHLRGILRLAAERRGQAVPVIAPAARDAA